MLRAAPQELLVRKCAKSPNPLDHQAYTTVNIKRSHDNRKITSVYYRYLLSRASPRHLAENELVPGQHAQVGSTWNFDGQGGLDGPWATGGQIHGLEVGPTWAAHIMWNLAQLVSLCR